jgi:hypothetical protein
MQRESGWRKRGRRIASSQVTLGSFDRGAAGSEPVATGCSGRGANGGTEPVAIEAILFVARGRKRHFPSSAEMAANPSPPGLFCLIMFFVCSNLKGLAEACGRPAVH